MKRTILMTITAAILTLPLLAPAHAEARAPLPDMEQLAPTVALPALAATAVAAPAIGAITPQDWFQLALGILGVIAAFFWARARISEENRKLFLAGLDVAYNVVNDISKRTETKVDDKAALGLAILRDYLRDAGKSPHLTPEQEAQAKRIFTAKHGAELATTEVLATAQAMAASIGEKVMTVALDETKLSEAQRAALLQAGGANPPRPSALK